MTITVGADQQNSTRLLEESYDDSRKLFEQDTGALQDQA